MFTSTAQADDPVNTGSNAGEPSLLMSAAPLLLIIVIFYFLLIRPQKAKITAHEDMIKALRRGDKVVTGGGVIGVISKIENDDTAVIEVAPDVKIRVMRETISHVITKTVANDNKADDK